MLPGRGTSRPAALLLLLATAAAALAALPRAAAQTCGGPMQLNHQAIVNDGKEMCMGYNKVCFDQEHVISYDMAYSPANSTSVRTPRMNITHLQYIWAGDEGGPSHTKPLHYPPLMFRFATELEGSPDLQKPDFSTCTVPVVIFTSWIHNFGEYLSHVVSRVWQLQADGAMSAGSSLVIGTPAGERAHHFVGNLLKPFSPYEVVTFAEFSERNPPPDAPIATSEGKPHRCFERAYLCAFGDDGWLPGLYEGLQAVHRHYQGQLPPAEVNWDSGDDVLKVLVERRTGPIRNLLNSNDLVDECNMFTGWQLPPESPFKHVQCRTNTFTGHNLQNMATVRGADLLVIVHGSACNNWLYMKEGSAMLELRPYEFGSKDRSWADWFYPQIAGKTGNKVFWYAVNIEDPEHYKPSDREVNHAGGEGADSTQYLRDRHVYLPFAILRQMIERIAAVGRSQEKYLALKALGDHYVELLPGGVLQKVATA